MKQSLVLRNVIIINSLFAVTSFNLQRQLFHTPQLSTGSYRYNQYLPCDTTTTFYANINDNDEFDVGETYDGEVDWDSEWKKVVQNQGQPKERPGKDFYKNDVEKAIGKTAKAAQEKISKIPKVKIDLPSRPRAMSFSDDAKLWLAIIAIISVASAVIGASGNINADYTNNAGLYDI